MTSRKEGTSNVAVTTIPTQNGVTLQILNMGQTFKVFKETFVVSCRAEQFRLCVHRRVVATVEDLLLRTGMEKLESCHVCFCLWSRVTENIELSKVDKGCALGRVCNCATLPRRIPPCLTQYSVMVTDDLTRTRVIPLTWLNWCTYCRCLRKHLKCHFLQIELNNRLLYIL